jgi:hypothetical protein
MGEDDWLEAAYEDRQGGEVDTSVEWDVDLMEDLLCDCGEPMDQCNPEHEGDLT